MVYISAILVMGLLGGSMAALLMLAGRFLVNYGPCRIKVNEKEPFVVEGGCTLMEALYEAKIFIPSACGGQGTCGLCKVKLPECAEPPLATETPFLSAIELEEHTRLACQVKVKKDLAVRVRPEYLDVKQYLASVAATRVAARETREIRLALSEPAEMAFKPGQYIQVMVPRGGTPTLRAYSICSSPGTKNGIELLVRLVPGGVGSTYLHRLRQGQDVKFTGPYGDFILDPDAGIEMVCVAGGCGMAPVRSIVRHLSEAAPARRCSVFIGVRAEPDLAYFDELNGLCKTMPNLEVCFALSEPGLGSEWKGETGFVHEAVSRRLAPGANRQAFLCGPKPMLEAVTGVLLEKGMARDRIYSDEF